VRLPLEKARRRTVIWSSMNVKDPTFNLTALADRLFAEGRLLPLVGAIRRARDVFSLSADLMHAAESLQALDALGSVKTSDLIGIATQSALMNNALVLYARGTKRTSKEHRGFDLVARFSEAEKATHLELCDLRDDAIAHFGSGGSYKGIWQAELVVLQVRGEDAKPGVITRRKTLDKKLMERARKQIEVAYAHLRALSSEKLNEVTREIDAAIVDNPDFYKEIERQPLNLDIFLSSPEASKLARDSFEVGHAKGVFTHD
jgi:hypothetical protein